MWDHISNKLNYYYILITYFPFLNPPTLYIFTVTKGHYFVTFLRIESPLAPILVHNGVHQSTVIIIGVDTFNVTSGQLTIEDFCDVTTQLKTIWSCLCCVECVVWG